MGSGPRSVLFLHGYTSPSEPSRDTLTQALDNAGVIADVHTPLAPEGDTRRDPFNPDGAASWFRYTTDRSALVPQGVDYADLADVYAVMYSPWVSHGLSHAPLWDQLATLVDRDGADCVALVGESQGGVMAALLGIEWNRQHPDNQLGWLGLVRTAPDPHTWQPRPPHEQRTFTFDPQWDQPPPRFNTHFCVVLGADDPTYRTYTSIAALGPLLINNPVCNPEIQIHYNVNGNVDLHVLPHVTHDSNEADVFAALAASLARDVRP